MTCIDHRHFQETARDRAEHEVATWTESDDAQRALVKIAADYTDTGDFDETVLIAIRADIIDDARRTFGEAWEYYFDGVVEPKAMGIEDAISMALDAERSIAA